jgi:A/G-specific adenine glycosylase
MDLGATICTPRQPRCMLCPVVAHCTAHRRGTPERYPIKAKKEEKPRRYGVAFLLVRPDGAVWLRRRPETGLLGGMLEVPSTDWNAAPPARAAARRAAPLAAAWRALPGAVAHGFTHFDLELTIWVAHAGNASPEDRTGIWVPADSFESVALPTVMRKVIAYAMKAGLPEAPGRPKRAASGQGR